jgi:type IV pilus assembly protein PilY1
MSRAMHRLKWLAAALLSFLAGLSSADDTEIYVGDGSVAQGVIFPNVLFVLDTSSSMTNTDNTGITRLERMKQALDQIISSSNNVNMGLMRFHREGGPVLFPVSNIHAAVEAVVPEEAAESDLVIPLSASADDAEESGDGDMVLGDAELELINKPDDNATGSLEVSVSHGDDDAEQFVSTGAMESLSSSDLELMHEYQGTASSQEIVGVRFLNVTVPSGAQIESARIRFQLDETKGAGDPVTIALYGEASPAAVRYASSSNDIGDRTRTNASVSWSPETGLSVGDRFYTPDLSSVVQEIVDQDAWASGNPMAFIIAYTSGSGLRCVESYNGSTSGAPRLELTYSVGSGSQDQVVGLRFQQVRVPQRATVTGARLELQAARSHSDTANLTLRAQDLGSALGFSADTGDISGRTTTEASVAWDELAAWTAGQRYQSPDLSSLIQEVVDRDDWP